ncbi:AP2 domain-containing protein [Leptospira andrefontaineae]|uniref:Fis family transcriptional regulator n=1 Tax=Leptospira andrefontaineae TaxID=2484976 RepID=A0A4R9H6P1_9LEPT|nr:AP2 domain-containing protein [Leptospira andrefontaineae]TGK41271.1 Fis family transcriptional regulator [Leptospira andrefontaineae]
MKKLIAIHGEELLVDDDDFSRLRKYTWSVKYNSNYTTAYRTSRNNRAKTQKMILLHREIMNVRSPKLVVIHKKGDWKDNRKKRLLVIEKGKQNFTQKNRKSNNKYKGITRRKDTGLYMSSICKRGKEYHLGVYEDPKVAAMAYDKAANILFGTLANTNKKLGLIKYKSLKDIQINLHVNERGRNMNEPPDTIRVSKLRKRLLKLRKKFTYEKIAEFCNVQGGTLYRFAVGQINLRSIAVEKIETGIRNRK